MKTYQPVRADQKFHNRACRRAAKYQRSKAKSPSQALIPVAQPDQPVETSGPFAGFTPAEVALGETRALELFQELGRRDSTKAEIESLVRKELILRYLETTYQAKRLSGGSADTEALMELKRLEESILRLKGDLGLNYASIEKRGRLSTTPANLISAYVDMLERLSPENLRQLQREEHEAKVSIQPRIQALLDKVTTSSRDKQVTAASKD